MQVIGPGTLRVQNNLMRVPATADLRLGGTSDRPSVRPAGDPPRRTEFEANRYGITRGSSISPTVPIDPYVDLEAGHRPDPGDAVQSDVIESRWDSRHGDRVCDIDRIRRCRIADIFQLLLGQGRTTATPICGRSTRATADAVGRGTPRVVSGRLLGGPISGRVERTVEKALGVALRPDLTVDRHEADPLNPSGRLVSVSASRTARI